MRARHMQRDASFNFTAKTARRLVVEMTGRTRSPVTHCGIPFDDPSFCPLLNAQPVSR